jgi:molecular chaperone IbpA
MRTAFDLTPFRRSSVGFDRLFDLLESGTALLNGETYPPFDLEQEGDDRYRITLAVAGFRPEEIEVTAQQNMLIVTGRKPDQSEHGRYIHRGIAARSFERRFVLGDHVDVRGAEFKDGLLRIELLREIPEEMKPRKIEIGSASEGGRQQRLTDQQQSANQNERETVAA